MRIQTGRGTIPLITLISIWSISAITSLPGLAISPIMGTLRIIFPHSSELEIQMLTSLPSLLIIPFVLLSGTLAGSKNKISILTIGLCLFLASGIMYFFAKSMIMLIVISCLLGIGAGMVIPLSTGLIADFFSGKYRVMQLGYSSAITNLTLVFATFLTGWLANFDWHYPFLIYTLPLISILLIKTLKGGIAKHDNSKSMVVKDTKSAEISAINIPRLWKLMALYLFATYSVVIISFNLPFMVQKYHIDSSISGVMISLFFLAIMLPGLFLNRIITQFKNNTLIYALMMMAFGLLIIYIFKDVGMIIAGCFLTGIGYGIFQPLIYDKTVDTASSDKTTLALAFVMTMNYLGILLCPFIVDMFGNLFNNQTDRFPFILNFVLTFGVAVYCYFYRDGETIAIDVKS